MDNATRRKLLERHKLSGFPGSIIDVFNAYDQGIDLVGQYMQQQQQQMQVANTPQEQEQGLRPAHQAGNTNASMAFPNTPPNASFNTVGMKAPIDLKQFDETGNLVKSYDAVPPGISNLKMSSKGGTVIETPAQMETGGVRKYQWAGPRIDGPRVPAMSDAEMSLKIIQEANAGNPAARRMRSDYGQRMFLPGETNPSTHYMASFDNYAVPTVQEDYIGGPLNYNPNPASSKADFRFDTPEQAAYFAKNYKQASAAKTFQQKNGGVRKAQNGLPPFSLEQQPVQAESTFIPNYGEQAFLNQMSAGTQNERVLTEKVPYVGPTISQGNFEVDKNNNIIEDRPSYLEMAANPMATARAILNPAVNGLPSQVEFNQSVNRGNPIGLAANDIVNPAAWANYGANALGDLGRGNFLSAGINALSAVPGLSLSGTAAATAGKQALNATVGQAARNVAYNLVDPYGYKPTFLSPKQILKNLHNPSGRPGSMYRETMGDSPDLRYLDGTARRLDAFALGLGKKPRYGTLRQIGENTYEPVNGVINTNHILSQTKDALTERLLRDGALGDTGSTIGVVDNTFDTMGGYHLTDAAIPGKPKARAITMNDKWDLHPFQESTLDGWMRSYPLTNKLWEALPTSYQSKLSSKLSDLEIFSALGGKPIDIQSHWTARVPEWTEDGINQLGLEHNLTGRYFGYPRGYMSEAARRPAELDLNFKRTYHKLGGVRKHQSGDFWTPVGMSNYIGEVRGGEPERFYNFADSVAYHESWHTMNPNMLQQPKKGVTTEDMERIGGKGAYQIESRSLPTYWQRMKNLSTRTGTPLPSWYNENETDARNLTYDQQKTLFLINMLEHGSTDMKAYGEGTATSADQWARGWKETYNDADIRAFETSMAKARKEGITLPESAQEWPRNTQEETKVTQEESSSWWDDFKSFFDFRNGGVRKFQGGSTPGRLIMDESGNLISVGLNDPNPVQSTPKPTETPKPKSTPKPVSRPAPRPVRTEPDVVPEPPITLPPTPPIETPVVTPPGTVAPENRNRVNYDTPDISRAIRRNVDIYTGAASEEGWYDAEVLSARNREWSQLPYEQMIAASRATYRPEDYYLISDNEKGTYGVYQGGRLVTEYEGLSGRNAGDAITAVPHPDGRPDYSAGNLTSGAGEFFLSNQYSTSEAKYNYAPSFNFALPNGNEQAMAIHGTPEGRLRYFENDNPEDNRQSYGCINGLCGDLKELFEMNLPKGTSWYSLPEEDRNKFEIIDGVPYLRAGDNAMKEAQVYTDAYGREQIGQGMNTLNRTKPEYREIRANIDMDAFRRDIFDETGEGIAGWFENTFTTDTTDEEEFAQTTQPFVDSLVDNKQSIMQATGISNDQYNLVAKLAFGILGTESTFGNTNSDANNAARFTSKVLKDSAKKLKIDLPLPDTNMDVASEYELFSGLIPRIHEEAIEATAKGTATGGPETPFALALANATDVNLENYSLGPTQLRWDTLVVRNKKGEIIDDSELKLVRSLGVNGPEDLNDPQKAAIATVAVLAHRINNRRAALNANTDEELIRALAGSWNNGAGYADKAIKNSQYLTLEQKDKMKLGGKKRSKYFSVRNRKPRK